MFNVVAADPASSAAGRFRIVFNQLITLPVTFTAVSAVNKWQGVLVQWNVASESGIRKYEVEHSTDGQRFVKIGEVAAANAGLGS